MEFEWEAFLAGNLVGLLQIHATGFEQVIDT